jgi:hypothetical protein
MDLCRARLVGLLDRVRAEHLGPQQAGLSARVKEHHKPVVRSALAKRRLRGTIT